MKQEAFAALAAMLFGFAAPAALSQAFPSHPVKIRRTGPPPEALATYSVRKLSDAMSKGLGQPVVVDNRPGANGFHRRGSGRTREAGWVHDIVCTP
jgi:tripartite-type tricarboxylate transporter receptor subunit TctC